MKLQIYRWICHTNQVNQIWIIFWKKSISSLKNSQIQKYPKNKTYHIKQNDFDTEIPEVSLEDDFTIIYKGREERDGQIIEPIEEIKTSKVDFFCKLRYFKSRIYEYIQINEILIHDTCPVETFKLFINTIATNKIRLNENNYSDLYKLSLKYQYYELQKQIDAFSKTRPDVQQIVNNYNTFDEIDSVKEEKLAKNLDICLQNPNMINFPLPVLNRILNSPNRILKNHHLLFNFIKKVINKNISKHNSNNNDDFQILFGSLDYLQMTNEELEELFSNKHFECIFGCRNSKEQMKTFIEERKFNQMRMAQLEEKMENLSSLVAQKIESFENHERESQEKIESMERKLVLQEQKINQSQSEKQDLLNIIHRLEEKLNELDEKVKIKPITGSITADVESNQVIKGTINLVEYNTKLDSDKSKFVINTSNEQKLGERAYESGVAIDGLSKNFSFSKRAGTYYVHAFIADNLGNTSEIVSGPLRTNGVAPLTFEYTGSVQSVTLEPGDYKLEVWGAEGGKNTSQNYTIPGKGGYSVGTLPLKSRTKLYIHVGQSPTNGIGGWNGGGSTNESYAGGGGATDISLYGSDGSSDWNNSNHLFSRIIVAGGGGGSGNTSFPQNNAGCGGGVNGQNAGGCSNSGGTQKRAGMSNLSTGQEFGIGGKQTNCCSGGGGGGWYGGASSDVNNGCGRGSGGGSGYVYSSSTASNYPSGCRLNSSFYLINATTIDGNCSFPNTSGSSNETGHNGNGYAKITLM